MRDTGTAPLPGSFLSQLHSDLDNLPGLGHLPIQREEEEEERRTSGQDLRKKYIIISLFPFFLNYHNDLTFAYFNILFNSAP